ncbi:MAG: FHA domain-containing protein, partial [Chloroflexi bacterium]|nr:FHA domain-containing protein [Chloroflexota bacterium]
HYHIPSIWERCRKPILWGTVIFGILLFVTTFSTHQFRTRNAPPNVTGTLRYWFDKAPMIVQCVDLTALDKPQIIIGQNESCEIAIEDPSLEEQHAVLKAERIDRQLQILLVPMGDIRLGYRQLRRETHLQHGDTFSLGNQDFQYLSDEGK